MNLERLFHIQNALDQKIRLNHGLEETNLVPQKLLALQVELGELANETRCFKYWSLKPASERSVILEEYVDGLHFIFSIGLDLSFDRDVILAMNSSKEDMPYKVDNIQEESPGKELVLQVFIQLYKEIAAFHQAVSRQGYLLLFQEYVRLGQVLGFQWSEIEAAYLDKNEVNHQRQADGY